MEVTEEFMNIGDYSGQFLTSLDHDTCAATERYPKQSITSPSGLAWTRENSHNSILMRHSVQSHSLKL